LSATAFLIRFYSSVRTRESQQECFSSCGQTQEGVFRRWQTNVSVFLLRRHAHMCGVLVKKRVKDCLQLMWLSHTLLRAPDFPLSASFSPAAGLHSFPLTLR